jgi:hypothetical protein
MCVEAASRGLELGTSRLQSIYIAPITMPTSERDRISYVMLLNGLILLIY